MFRAVQMTGLVVACYVAGELFAVAVNSSFPGPIVGMVLMFAVLACLRQEDQDRATAVFLLRHIGVLFVPAAAGFVAYADSSSIWNASVPAVALVVGTILTIFLTAVFLRLGRQLLIRADEHS